MTTTIALLTARLIFAALFLMACGFKFADMAATADYIALAGFPLPLLLAWLAAFFELGLVLAFLTGAFFREAALAAAGYVLFLAFTFHGPSHWQANQAEFGFFVDHFSYFAGLLFAAVHGPGKVALSLELRRPRAALRSRLAAVCRRAQTVNWAPPRPRHSDPGRGARLQEEQWRRRPSNVGHRWSHLELPGVAANSSDHGVAGLHSSAARPRSSALPIAAATISSGWPWNWHSATWATPPLRSVAM